MSLFARKVALMDSVQPQAFVLVKTALKNPPKPDYVNQSAEVAVLMGIALVQKFAYVTKDTTCL